MKRATMGVSTMKERVRAWGDRGRARAAEARERWPVLDHLVRTLRHYGEVLGNQLAGAVTYFGFLSFFPIIALAFAAVGYIIEYVPDADAMVTQAIESILPGMVGTDPGQIDVQQIASRRTGVGVVGLLGLLYSGLGWVSALRASLRGVFRSVLEEKRNFVIGKIVDLAMLATIGFVLVATVSLSTAVGGFTRTVIDWLGLLDVPGTSVLLRLTVLVVGVAANTVLFFTMYKLLPKHNAPTVAVWQGALIAAVGFEILKQLANVVISSVTQNALYGAFAIMIALLVWIHYFARLAIMGACWAATAGIAEAEAAEAAAAESDEAPGRGVRFLMGLASAAGVVALGFSRGRQRREAGGARSG